MDATTTRRYMAKRAEQKPGTRIGYVVAALVNLGVLWFVNQLLGWEWPPFLTGDFEEILPWLNASLIATIVVNVIWAVRDPAWFRHLGQIGLNILSLVVAVLTWQVFPFDFSAYSDVWDTVARVVIVVAIVGVSIATLVEFVRLVLPGGTGESPQEHAPPTERERSSKPTAAAGS